MAGNLLLALRAKAGRRYEAVASQLTAVLPVTSVPTQGVKLRTSVYLVSGIGVSYSLAVAR